MADLLKDRIGRAQCENCHKPFHLAAQPKSDAPGEEEIRLNCPYCDTPLLVKVPRRFLPQGVLLRGIVAR